MKAEPPVSSGSRAEPLDREEPVSRPPCTTVVGCPVRMLSRPLPTLPSIGGDTALRRCERARPVSEVFCRRDDHFRARATGKKRTRISPGRNCTQALEPRKGSRPHGLKKKSNKRNADNGAQAARERGVRPDEVSFKGALPKVLASPPAPARTEEAAGRPWRCLTLAIGCQGEAFRGALRKLAAARHWPPEYPVRGNETGLSWPPGPTRAAAPSRRRSGDTSGDGGNRTHPSLLARQTRRPWHMRPHGLADQCSRQDSNLRSSPRQGGAVAAGPREQGPKPVGPAGVEPACPRVSGGCFCRSATAR